MYTPGHAGYIPQTTYFLGAWVARGVLSGADFREDASLLKKSPPNRSRVQNRA